MKKSLHTLMTMAMLWLGMSMAYAQNEFITTWQTTSANESITIPTFLGELYSYNVAWGDGGTSTAVTGNASHTYAAAGTYTVSITGTFPRIYFNNAGDKTKIKTIEQWGNIAWSNMEKAFYGCSNLTYNATDAPDLSNVTNMSYMFANAFLFNGAIGNWDVSTITNMNYLFSQATSFNQDISSWNVGNVTTMIGIFGLAASFNQNIAAWDVSKVIYINYAFSSASSFNQNIGSWNVGNVTNMSNMFQGASAFNQNLNSWDVSKVTNMAHMFSSASSFNGDISSWNVSNVIGMANMFFGASSFNQNINGWDVSKITSMTNMFKNAAAFNQNLNSWNVSGVVNMSYMFQGATSFNGALSNWNVGNVTDMKYMFNLASSFNQAIGSWNVSKVTSMNSMFSNASAFNQDISSWNVSAVTDMGNMFVNNVAFNQNIASWNVSSVSTFSNMFSGASAFNQPIGNWTTTNLTSTSQMFYNASSFDQNLGSWDVSKVTSMSNMFSNSGLSGSNYDNILIGWAAQTVQSGVALGAIGVTYCTGETGRNTLTGTYSWSISGDSKNCPPTNILLDATTINERNSINDLVATLSSTDDVGDTHTYDLVTGFGSLDNASFSVSGNQLLANTVFDFETKTIYAIRIRSTDNKGNWFEKGLFININDITGLSQSITFNTLTPVTYGDAGFSLTATASSGLGVSYISSDETVATVSGSNVTIVGPGTTTITASQAGDGDFAAATPVDQALTVNKASQTITFNTLADKIYGEVAFDLTGTASSTLGVSFVSSDPLVATISGNTVTIVGAGTTTITASQTGDANYNAATDVPHTLTVNKAVLTATADDKIITYGDVIPALTFTYSGFVNGEDATALTAEPIAGTTATGSSDAGTYNITLTGGTADNYSFLLVNGTLTISKADQIISITPIANKVVTDGSFDVTASTTSTLPLTYSIQSGPATITGNTITLDGTTGTVVVEVTQAGNTSFNAAAQTVSFTVTDPSKTDQTITFAALATKTYGDADFDLTAAASSGLAVSYTSSNTAVATVSGSTVTIIGAGTTEITAAQTGNATFNPAADAVQPLTVNKADQTISVDPIADKQPGTTPFDVITTVSSGLNIVYSITGPATISGATITLDGTLGVVTLTASQPGNNNYNAATDVQVSFNVSSTALLDQTITLDPVADKATTEGPFEIVASASSGLAVSLSVTGPATVTGTTVTLNGTAGTVTVTASQAGDTNYSPATAETSFQVIEYRVAQTITFGAIDNQLMEEGSLTLSGSASSALPVVYEIVSGPATVAGNVITFTALGTVVVRASQPGDNAFFPADPIEQTFDIITITGVDPARLSEVTFYPNPVVDQITLQTSTLKVVQVNLLNLSGQIAFSTRKDFEHLNVGHLKTGHYILQIVTDKEVITKKLIKN